MAKHTVIEAEVTVRTNVEFELDREYTEEELNFLGAVSYFDDDYDLYQVAQDHGIDIIKADDIMDAIRNGEIEYGLEGTHTEEVEDD